MFSSALIPQQRQSMNGQIFARLFEQRYGQLSYMKHRSISRTSAVVEQKAVGIVRCVKPAGSSLQTQLSAKFSSLALQKEDYRIYPQSVDLEAFFGEAQKCEKVSDVCLLNDHFILVKMPEDRPSPPAAVQRNLGSRLPRCFKCNRGSRVSPILEELEEPEPRAYKPWSSHDDEDVEVFDSRTRIIPAHNRHQLQAISAPTPKKISVVLEQPQPQRTPAVASLQLDTLQSQTDPYPHPISRGPLHWFLWPFRRRSASRAKAQLAAVHKTYFVRWNKPPDTLFHGYGVERAIEPDNIGLRRCRSAIF